MTPRELIGTDLTIVRALDLHLGDQMLGYQLSTGLYKLYTINELRWVGDDVEIECWGRGEVTTSQGNAVIIKAREE